MNILVIEDEMPAAERLCVLLKQYDASIQILGCLEGIDESVQWLKTNPHPDLLLMDIHLSDGHSFEIFRQVELSIPVIFTTAYDTYAVHAFRHYSIDYIMKPVTAESLGAALNKYRSFSQHFTHAYCSNELRVPQEPASRYKERFLAKVGQRTFFIQRENVAYFCANNKTVFVADSEGHRFIIKYSIEKLEPLLDPYYFFRVNRKIIVHSKMIEQVKPFFTNRLKITLRNQPGVEDIIVSRKRVPAFKKWAGG